MRRMVTAMKRMSGWKHEGDATAMKRMSGWKHEEDATAMKRMSEWKHEEDATAMKRMRRWAVFAVCLAAAAMSACTGAAPGGQRGVGAAEPPASLRVMKPLYPGHYYYPDSALERQIEEELDVELTYETAAHFEYPDVLAVKIAGGTIPDIVQTQSPNDPAHNSLIDQGVFLPLDDLLPLYPKLLEAFSDSTWDDMRNPKDGKIYGVPWMRDRGGAGIFIRSDWLERFGLEMPQTLSEFRRVLEAFRDGDPDGNGVKDTIPLTFKDHQASWIGEGWLPLFGYNPGWHPSAEDPEKLVYGLVQPGMKEVLSSLRRMRSDGLLDPDLFVGSTLGIDKFKSGKVGALVGILGDYRQFAVLPGMEVEILDPLRNGEHAWSLVYPSMPISRTNQISSASPHPEAALRYLEYQVAEGFDAIQYGVEGKTYEVVNGVKTPFPADRKDPQYSTNVGLELVQPEWLFTDPEKYTKFVSVDTANYILSKLDLYERHVMYSYLRPNISMPLLQEKWGALTAIVESEYVRTLLEPGADIEAAYGRLVSRWTAGGGDRVTDEINRLQEDKSMPDYEYRRKP